MFSTGGTAVHLPAHCSAHAVGSAPKSESTPTAIFELVDPIGHVTLAGEQRSSEVLVYSIAGRVRGVATVA